MLARRTSHGSSGWEWFEPRLVVDSRGLARVGGLSGAHVIARSGRSGSDGARRRRARQFRQRGRRCRGGEWHTRGRWRGGHGGHPESTAKRRAHRERDPVHCGRELRHTDVSGEQLRPTAGGRHPLRRQHLIARGAGCCGRAHTRHLDARALAAGRALAHGADPQRLERRHTASRRRLLRLQVRGGGSAILVDAQPRGARLFDGALPATVPLRTVRLSGQ